MDNASARAQLLEHFLSFFMPEGILDFKRLKINQPWEVTDFSATGVRERRLIQKSKQPKGNLISTAEFYAVNG